MKPSTLKSDIGPATIRFLALLLFSSALLGWAIALSGMLQTSSVSLPNWLTPFYGYMPVPETGNAAGADFSPVYTGMQALKAGQSIYFPESPQYKDLFQRMRCYPVFTHWLFLPLSHFPHAKALQIHSWLQMSIFFLVTLIVLAEFGLVRLAPLTFACYVAALLFTPCGLTHFERGQWDLYMASSLLLYIAAVYSKKPSYALAAGLFLSLKWSLLPFIGIYSLIDIGSGGSRKTLPIILSILCLTIAAFPTHLKDFVTGMLHWESTQAPLDLSFKLVFESLQLPLFWGKLVIVFSGAALLICAITKVQVSGSNRRWFKTISFPAALSLTIQSIGFQTVSHEYHAVIFLAFIPFFLIWSSFIKKDWKTMEWVVSAILVLFLLISLRTFAFVNLTRSFMPFFYLATSLTLLLACLHRSLTWGRTSQQTPNGFGAFSLVQKTS